jgi:DNA ligase-4
MNDSDDKPDNIDLRTSQRIEARIQDKINAGYTAPCGWLFRGLTLFFYSHHPDKHIDGRLRVAQNTARFANAASASSVGTAGITHVVVDPDTLSSGDISSLRKSIAAKSSSKIPHLVSVDWIEECWQNGTLLDEERFQVRR